MFARLADFVSRHWLLVLLAWVAIPVTVHLLAPRWEDVARDGDFAFLPAGMTSVQGEKLLRQAFPHLEGKAAVVLVVARPNDRLHEADFAVARQLVEQFAPKRLAEGDSPVFGVFSGDDERKLGQSPGRKPGTVPIFVAGGHENGTVPFGRTIDTEDRTVPNPGQSPGGPIAAVRSFDDPILGGKLISTPTAAGQATLVMIELRTELMAVENMALVARVEETLDAVRQQADFPPGLKLGLTGSAAVGADMLFSAQESIRNTERATVALVVLILLLVYRAPGLVVVPLLTIFASMTLSTGLIAMLAQLGERVDWLDFKVFRTTKIFIVVVLYGAATDYCLFLVARYREELQRGRQPPQAIRAALGGVGHAVAASAATTILGLGTMIFAAFGKYRYGGPTIALSLAVALLACLTLTPALLRAGGRIVFWPFGAGPMHDAAAGRSPSLWTRVWQRIARAIVTRPGAIFIGCLLLLAWPAYEGLFVPITYDLVAELDPHRPSVQGTDLLGRYYAPGEVGPITVLAKGHDADFKSRQGQARIAQLTREFYELRYVDSRGVACRPILRVRSLTNPLGDALGSYSPFTPAGRRHIAVRKNRRAVATYLSDAPGFEGNVTRLDLVCQYDPFSRESVRLLDRIDAKLQELRQDPSSAWYGSEFDFVGTTAGIRDLEAVNRSDYFRIGLLTSLAVLAVLVAVLRRPLVSVYLVLTVLLGFFVSIGVTKLVFMAIYGATFHGLDWKLPLFLFVILVAVGEDYNIYLATRVVEEQRRRGAIEGLRVAVVRTGGIITSCGVIMAGTFASMMTGTLRGMHELGFSLAFGVLLDTFVIRTILVPAFLALWARWLPHTVPPKQATATAKLEPD